MATNGIVITNTYEGNNGNRYLEVAWEKIGIDVAAQTTTIKWTLTSRGTYTGYFMSAPFTVGIDSTTIYNSTERIKLYRNQELASGEYTIKHNTDGTKTFTLAVSGAIYKSYVNVSGSGNFELDLVGMARITEAPNFTDERNPTIKYYNPVGNAISSLQACISLTGETPDIEYRDIAVNGDSYTFNLTDNERKILRAATQGSINRKVRFYLRNVVNGEILFDWKEVNFTVINATPTIEASVIDTNAATVALTGDNSTLIRYHSTATATMAATAYKEATIEKVQIEHNTALFGTNSIDILKANSNVFTFYAVDSRNIPVNTTIVAPMIDYIKPTANIDNTQRMDTTGYYNLRVSGNYYNDTFGYTDAAAANELTVYFRYKEQGGNYNEWERIANSLDGNTYTAQAFVNGLNYRKAYVFQCRVVDKLNTVISAEITVRSIPVFHWGENDFVFEVPVVFNAGFTDETGAAAIDDTGGGSTATAGSWQPSLTTSGAVSSYTMRQGWYQKIGNVITIGFNIKATINSGYSGTNIAISGLPFTPAHAAFGGGIAHNIYLSAGFCFEGFAAGTDGLITLRGQPCNNTTAGNLNITSTAYYPTGSNQTLTLAGTICYTV